MALGIRAGLMALGTALRNFALGGAPPAGTTFPIWPDEGVRALANPPAYVKDGRVRVHLNEGGKVSAIAAVTVGLTAQEMIYSELIADLGAASETDTVFLNPFPCRAVGILRHRPRIRSINAVWRFADGIIIFMGGDFSAGLIARKAP